MAVTGKLFYLLVLKLPRFESEHRRFTELAVKAKKNHITQKARIV